MSLVPTDRPPYFPLGLQLAARARKRLDLPDEAAGPAAGDTRLLQHVARRLETVSPAPVRAAELNLLARLNRALAALARRHLEAHRCRFVGETLRVGDAPAADTGMDGALGAFVELFPPAAVRRGLAPGTFLSGAGAASGRQEALVELLVLSVQTENEAAAAFRALFDDADLARRVPYRKTLRALDRRLGTEPAPGKLGRPLLSLLREPLEASPRSLAGQVAHLREHWGDLLPEELLRELQIALDVLAEEEAFRGFGPGPSQALEFRRDDHYDEPEAFSADADWMPNVVLVAKSVHVWLDQLSGRYGRAVTRLDQIPGEELERLARWGFNALWLIGIWERSSASQRIKQRMGNREAAASAYSLYDYTVACDLGGEGALADLEARCAAHGIRLASDIVPNHTGLCSRWLLEHPDWYLQTEQPPYINYRFTGPDLSDDPAVSLQLEDGYWDHSDAAVVFRHTDRTGGRVRYIYHGNDGTHMPWNDTAQLNYLLPEVREAVIRTIVAIARRFRVIRFDAAMTLAKKHYQRLWFPQPGGGAGVPSRAEHSMTREDFDCAFPVEFWREVVDRVAAEVPDTLLIAEAFWLMEGYFVRTLGMHRVYNSAFMNMLKQEENAKYRQTIKNVLAFDPAILQRFVNFMNNPDEATAVEQFGKGDKYFGVAVLLATLPGLPMFGHGQVEGLREKYGMEYRRAYWEEAPDEAFVRHHEAQIFPLLHRRRLFSGAENFELYDFRSGVHVDENVFAFTNGAGAERALVVYHNRHGETGGWLHSSVPRRRDGSGEGLTETPLALALGLEPGPGSYLRFRDHRSGLEYLLAAEELDRQGLHLTLGPYEYRVFLEFRTIEDSDGNWGELCRALAGRPVADLELELRRLRHAPLTRAFRPLVEGDRLRRLAATLALPTGQRRRNLEVTDFAADLRAFLEIFGATFPEGEGARPRQERLLAELVEVVGLAARKGRRRAEKEALATLRAALQGESFLPFLLFHRLAEPAPGVCSERRSADLFEEYLLEEVLGERGLPVRLLVRHQSFWAPAGGTRSFARLLADDDLRDLLQVHRADGEEWFNREALVEWSEGLYAAGANAACGHFADDRPTLLAYLVEIHGEWQELLATAAEAGYRLDRFEERLRRQQEARYPRPLRGHFSKRLKILVVASEVTPFAKSGGLADVAGSLPPALQAMGHEVRVVMPYYRAVAARGERLERGVASVEAEVAGGARTANLHRGELDGVPVYFVENQEYFERDGLYASEDGDYADNHRRFGFFCRALLEALPRLGFRPDVIHLNDWQTGLVPALLRSDLSDDPFYAGIGTLLTIHNLGYQGMFGPEILAELGLDNRLGSMEGMEYYGNLSFLKGGLVFSDLLNTVSETYCREIQTPAYGCGFDGILRHRGDDLFGILNGLDPAAWDPAADSALPAPFSVADLSGKALCKAALQRELGLAVDPEVPVVAMVTRLDTQKGLELVEEAWPELRRRRLQFVLLGTGSREHTERFARIRGSEPERVSINLTFDDALSRRIYAGSDLFLMPSLYEPCGLGQLIALRYGAVPLVRRTGGLADTIRDPQQDAQHANGFTFDEPRAPALLETLDRALEEFAERERWRELMRRGMEEDFSWGRSAERYLGLYRLAMEKCRDR